MPCRLCGTEHRGWEIDKCNIARRKARLAAEVADKPSAPVQIAILSREPQIAQAAEAADRHEPAQDAAQARRAARREYQRKRYAAHSFRRK
jgi:hypothetical protein